MLTVQAQIQKWDSYECTLPNGNPGKCSCLVDGVPTLKCLEIVFGNILFLATSLIILVLFVMFVIGAFKYITSTGNPEKIKEAQGTIKYAVVGTALFLGSYLILKIVQVLFLEGGDISLFKFEIPQF